MSQARIFTLCCMKCQIQWLAFYSSGHLHRNGTTPTFPGSGGLVI